MPALLSPATPGPQPGLRSRSAREGASLYYLSASLGTWPLSSQPGMEPVPPALRQWRLSHRTPGRPRRRSSVSARWVARCPQALRVLCSHACGCGCPPRRVLGDGVPTSPAPHSPSPARGPRLCPRARLRAWPRVLGPEPGGARQPGPCPALASPRPITQGGRECLGPGPAHPHLSGCRGPSPHISIPPGRVTAGRSDPHATASWLGWRWQPGPTGPPACGSGLPAGHRPRPTTERVHRRPGRAVGAPACPLQALGPRGRAVPSAITAGVPSVAQLPQDCGSRVAWTPPLPPDAAGRGAQRRRQGSSPRASVSSPGEGGGGLSAIRWGSEAGPAERHRHPTGPPRPGPGPRACSLRPGLAAREGLKALPLYQARSLARGLPWCRGLPRPQGTKAPGDQAPARERSACFSEASLRISGDPTAKCGHRNTAAATQTQRSRGQRPTPQRVDGRRRRPEGPRELCACV